MPPLFALMGFAFVSASSATLHDAILRGADEKTLTSFTANPNVTNGKNESALHLAVNLDNYEACRVLIKRNADVNFIDGSKASPLHHATRGNNLRIVNLLLERGADVNGVDVFGRTALMIAAKYGYVRVAKALMVNNPGKNTKVGVADSNGWTIYHHAANGGHVDVINLVALSEARRNKRNAEGKTPLHLAIVRGRMDAVFALLNKVTYVMREEGRAMARLAAQYERISLLVTLMKFNFESRDDRGNTILMSAVAAAPADVPESNEEDHFPAFLEIIKALILIGVDLEAVNDDGETAADLAMKRGNYAAYLTITRAITEGCSRGSAKKFLPPLHGEMMKEKPDLKRVRSLLHRADAMIDETDYLSRTPVHLAVESDDVEIVRELISKGCDLTLKNAIGNTALHLTKSAEVARLLLRANPKLADVANEGGNLPLHVVVYDERKDLVEIIAPNTTNIHARNNMGYKPLDAASKVGNIEIMNCVLKHGKGTNKGRDGMTPLFIAALRGDARMVNFLVKNGWNVSTPDANGLTAAHSALSHGLNVPLIRFLIKGLQPDFVNVLGYSLLHWAAAFNGNRARNPKIIRALIQHGVPMNLKTFRGRTALHIFVKYGNVEAVRLLVDGGADVTLKTPFGRTPLHVACRYLQAKCAAVLMRANRNILSWKHSNDFTPVRSLLNRRSDNIEVKTVVVALELTAEDVRAEDLKKAIACLSKSFVEFIDTRTASIAFQEYAERGIEDFKKDNVVEDNGSARRLTGFAFKGLGIFYAFIAAYYPEWVSKKEVLTLRETEKIRRIREEYRDAAKAFEIAKNKNMHLNELRCTLVDFFMSQEGRKRLKGTYANSVPQELIDDVLVDATNNGNVWGRMELMANSMMLTFKNGKDVELHRPYLRKRMSLLSEIVVPG